MNAKPMTYFVAMIDDDQSCCDLAAHFLAKSGISVASFNNANDFLGAPENCSFDCIILDMDMPEMNGFELQCLLKERGFSLPILFVTASADASNAANVLRNGAFDMISKPFTAQSLTESVLAAITSTLVR